MACSNIEEESFRLSVGSATSRASHVSCPSDFNRRIVSTIDLLSKLSGMSQLVSNSG